MRTPVWLGVLVCWAAVGAAEDDAPAPPAPASSPAALAAGPAPAAATPAHPSRPRGVAPGAAAQAGADATAAGAGHPPPAASGTATPSGTAAPVMFVAEEKWGMAGYNNNEPVYTILVTSRDERIMRCTADLKGTYIENGAKLSIADRQTATIFPNQQVQIGNWAGMDQQSGATYSVKCRPV